MMSLRELGTPEDQEGDTADRPSLGAASLGGGTQADTQLIANRLAELFLRQALELAQVRDAQPEKRGSSNMVAICALLLAAAASLLSSRMAQEGLYCAVRCQVYSGPRWPSAAF